MIIILHTALASSPSLGTRLTLPKCNKLIQLLFNWLVNHTSKFTFVLYCRVCRIVGSSVTSKYGNINVQKCLKITFYTSIATSNRMVDRSMMYTNRYLYRGNITCHGFHQNVGVEWYWSKLSNILCAFFWPHQKVTDASRVVQRHSTMHPLGKLCMY